MREGNPELGLISQELQERRLFSKRASLIILLFGRNSIHAAIISDDGDHLESDDESNKLHSSDENSLSFIPETDEGEIPAHTNGCDTIE